MLYSTFGMWENRPLPPVQAKRNKYDSERCLVACTCGECVSKCGTNGKKTPKYDKRNHRQKEEKAKNTNTVAEHQELLIGTPAVLPSLPLSSPTGIFQPHNHPTSVATCDPPTGLADTNADVFDMLASRMPSQVSGMDVSVSGFDFVSEMDIDEIQSSTGDIIQQDQLCDTEDMLLDDFPDAEDKDSGPQRTNRALPLSNTGEDMLAPAAAVPGSD
ncbi:hypothetical protein C8R48DRAFT_680487 [Suillus tomentosus]|nr:hypothetical protein C8R48DRAFT_680487 [Suillus tomentosus]